MTKSNSSLQNDVIDELTFDPAVDETTIGVTAKDGVVTLTGTVRSYPEKIVAEELKIEISTLQHRSDADLARAAVAALDWNFQRDGARRAVEHLIGLHGVTNGITVKPAVSTIDVKAKIRQAFERYAEVDANKVEVQVAGDTVTLRGNVHCWNEHDKATYAAASVPGVLAVHNYTHVV